MIRDRLAQSAPGGKEVFRATAALKENRDLRVSKGFLVRPALKDSKEIAAVPDHRENRAPSVRQGPKASVAKAALKVLQADAVAETGLLCVSGRAPIGDDQALPLCPQVSPAISKLFG